MTRLGRIFVILAIGGGLLVPWERLWSMGVAEDGGDRVAVAAARVEPLLRPLLAAQGAELLAAQLDLAGVDRGRPHDAELRAWIWDRGYCVRPSERDSSR